MNTSNQTHYAEFSLMRKTIKIVGISKEDVKLQLETLNQYTVNSDIEVKEIVQENTTEDLEQLVSLIEKRAKQCDTVLERQFTTALQWVLSLISLDVIEKSRKVK